MAQKMKKGVFKTRKGWIITGLIVLVLVIVSFIGVLHASTGISNGTASVAAPMMAQHSLARSAAGTTNDSTANSPAKPNSNSAQYGPQYLQKSLQVSIEVPNPTQAASNLQQWLASADPQATSDGSNYENAGGNQYDVTLTYLVDVNHYTQVENYLRTYAGQHGNTLLSSLENVQDDTNDYIDSQSTLTNLRAEQQRLLTFMNETQNVNDAVNIEQQLAQVEGQIDSIEAHLNALTGQTTFYTVTISLQPVGSVAPTQQPNGWGAIPVWQGAWSAVVGVWQVLATLLIWLAAFSVYIVPALLIIWLVRKRWWKRVSLPHVAPAFTAPMPMQESEIEPEGVDIE